MRLFLRFARPVSLPCGIGLSLLALVLASLAGCLAREPEPVVRLEWWITYAKDSDEFPAFEAVAEAFTEKTGTLVELVPVPWEDLAPRGTAAPRLSTRLESGSGPDLFGPVPHTWVEPYVVRDQALRLDPAQMRSHSRSDVLAQQAARLNGGLFALPILMDSVTLVYNRAMVPKPPTTFEQLLQIAREHTQPEEDQWGLVLPLLSPTHIYPFVDGYGGYLFACELTAADPTAENIDPGLASADPLAAPEVHCDSADIGLNNTGAAQGVQLVTELYTKDQLFPSTLADPGQAHDRSLELFVQGKAAMLIDGPWALPSLRASGIDYDVAILPALPGASRAPRPWTVVHSLVASAQTAHPQQVIDLMNHLSDSESIVVLASALDTPPVRRDVLRRPEVRHLQGWRSQATAGVLLPSLPELDVVWSPWARALAEAIPGLRPVQEALDQAVDEIKDSLGTEDALEGTN